MKQNSRYIVAVRGGGDIATGVVQKFFRAGFCVVILETPKPTAIRRNVCLSEAVYEGKAEVEDIPAQRLESPEQLGECWASKKVALLVDPSGESLGKIRPHCLVDAILAKRNLGTRKDMAGVTIGLGPGFYAGRDVDAVIETMRGHSLGRLITSGPALTNTGSPGEIGGKSEQRVLRSPADGVLVPSRQIGEVVKPGESVFEVGGQQVKAPFEGVIRGLLRGGSQVFPGMKSADIDPRLDVDWQTISDKARCIGGAVLEAFFYLEGAR